MSRGGTNGAGGRDCIAEDAILIDMLDCIMPAAGASSRLRFLGSRMRAPGKAFKPLLPFRGSTIVETSAAAALGAGCRLILVVGHRSDEVEALFGEPRYREPREEGRLLVVRNPRWEEGLLGSIQSALPLLGSEAFFVAHADMPFVESGHYASLAAARAAWAGMRAKAAAQFKAFLPAGAAGPLEDNAFVAACEGKRGHPVLIPSAWAAEIAALPPGDGLRAYLGEMPSALVEIGPAALRDIDTPGDYERALRG
jgi:molybdenum cofactor cytidylyltransferase